ncbi:MAG: class I SAM-dependent methyltransferase [Candidatus Daviesbacteria bacterium]|nr:class I SAM-dependent methyltransferase [Candidatus Daviesbacteria bacterium]
MTKCRVCSNYIKPFFSLGDIPLVNLFLTKEGLKKKEAEYDLTVGFCNKCYLVQLMKTISPKDLFENYIYFSSTSQTIIDHSRSNAEYFTRRFNLNKKNLVVEIASNDGVQLDFFQQLGIRILGIDPAKNIAALANKKSIKTLPEFFNLALAKKLNKKGLRADLIFGANVLAHVPKIVDFVKGVRTLLKINGTAIFEFPYIRGLLENKFDTIYHEHVFYYSLIALRNLFESVDLELYDVDLVDMQGGSLRIYVSHPNSFKISKNVTKLVKKELDLGFNKLSTYNVLNKNINILKKDLIKLLNDIKTKNKHVAVYSAPAKGNILMNYFGIDSKLVDFIVDRAKEKQGLYTPGTHMQVFPVEKIYQEEPDYLLILCWNIYKEVIEQLKEYQKNGGKFIIPIPKIRII